jgi:sulfur carrier protein
MEIFINNRKTLTTAGKILSGLLEDLSFQDTRGIAIAINNEVIPKSSWHELELKDSDRVTIITATQGG